MEDVLLKAVRELPMAEPPEVKVGDGTATMTWPLFDQWTVKAYFGADEDADVDLMFYDTEGAWSIESFAGADEEMLAALLDFERHLESLRWLVRLLIEMAGES